MEKKSPNHDGLQQDDVIEQLHNYPQDLNALLSGITPGNLHKEVDFGQTVGKEILWW